jgi:hypothetical protein
MATISVRRYGNHVWIYRSGGQEGSSYAHLNDTPEGLIVNGDPTLLQLFGGTRRGLVDFDNLDGLYKGIGMGKAA